MTLLADIFLLVTLPIIAMIVVGWTVQSRLPESRKVLSFIYANVVLPAFMIHFVSTTTLPLTAMWPVVWFTLLQGAVVGVFGWLVSCALQLDRSARPVVTLGGVFGNTGNFGVPLAILAFPAENTVHQAIIAATTAVVFVPLCSLMLSPGSNGKTWLGTLLGVLLNPIVLGVCGGVALKAAGIVLPVVIAKPLQMLAAAYTGIALMGLGAALYGGTMQLAAPALRTTLVVKLLASPLLTWLMAWALGFSGTLLALLVVAASMPTAALVGVIAAENPKMRATAASSVFVSTLLAPLVVTLWIFIMRHLSP